MSNVMTSGDERVRLSRYVLFVDYDAQVEVHHTLRGTVTRVDRATYSDLLTFRRFHQTSVTHARWRDEGVLVAPYEDTPEHHGGFRALTEAKLGDDYQQWYWQHEVESQREYKWLGESIVKMPSDLFFYQELIAANRLDSVLEVGYGNGGALWFFATTLALLRGGCVVGVDWVESNSLPPFSNFPTVSVDLLHGDAHAAATIDRAVGLRPQGFGLVVIDADPDPAGKMDLLRKWSPAVAPGGFLIVEDVESPRGREARKSVLEGIDDFLLENDAFGLAIEAARSPLLKASGAAFFRVRS